MAPPPSLKKATTKTTVTMKTPESLDLNRYWRVGRQLGEGAQASVHVLVNQQTKHESAEFVVKIARLPDTLAAPKRKKSLLEINADSLNGEFHSYNRLSSIQGTLIPKLAPFSGGGDAANGAVPPPPLRGDIVVDGKAKFRYLVLQRMDAPLFSLVDRVHSLVSSSTTTATASTKIPVGPVFARLIDIAKAFHASGLLIVDVKADNLMLLHNHSHNNNKTSTPKRRTSPQLQQQLDAQIHDMVDEIRLLDLALARSFLDCTRKHRPNLEGQELQGTPWYASLHVHDGHTVARRDDLMSLGIVMAELLIRLNAALEGTQDLYEPNSKTNKSNKFPSYLPWANEANEDAMGNCKAAQLLNRQSEFYQRLPSTVASTMRTFFDRVHDLEYDQKPPYEDLTKLVQPMTIPVPAGKVASAARKTKSASKTATAAATARLKSPPVAKSAAAAATTATARLKSPPAAATTTAVAASTSSSPSPRPRTSRTSRATAVEAPVALTARTSDGKMKSTTTSTTTRHHSHRGAKRAAETSGKTTGPTSSSFAGAKVAKVHRRRSAAASAAAAKKNDDEDDDDVDMEIDESFSTAHTSPSDDNDTEFMDVEEDDDDEVVEIKAVGDSKKPATAAAAKKASTERGLELRVVAGPVAGKSYYLIQGDGKPQVLVLGSKPPNASPTKGRNNNKVVSVSIPDSNLAASHAKLTLVVTVSRNRTIELQNLSGNSNSNNTASSLYVNDKLVSTKVQVFSGDSIRLGSTVMSVMTFDGPMPSLEKENVARRATSHSSRK